MKNPIRGALISLAGVLMLSTSAPCQDASRVKSDAESWVRDAQSTYRLDCESKKKIWEALCGLLDPEDGEEYNIPFAKDIAYQLQQDERSKVEPVLSRLKDLRKNTDELAKDSKNDSVVRDIRSMLDKEDEKLKKLQNDLVLRGADHPFVQYAIDYGKQRHQSLHSSLSGIAKTRYDVTFGSDKRPDCVLVNSDGLWVYEFKPNHSRAVSAGKSRESGYVRDVVSYYKQYFGNGRKGAFTGSPDSDHGGESFLKALRDQDKCWDGDRLTARFDVITYDPCDKRFDCYD